MALSRYIPSIFKLSLDDQAVKLFCGIWHHQDIPSAFMHLALLLQNPVASTLNEIFIYKECTSEFTHYTGQNSHQPQFTTNAAFGQQNKFILPEARKA